MEIILKIAVHDIDFTSNQIFNVKILIFSRIRPLAHILK